MKKVQVVTSKYSKSGAMLTYISDVEMVNGKMVLSNTSRINGDSAYCAYVHNQNDAGAAEVMIWAVARSESEVAEMVAEKFAELAGTYSLEEAAEVEVEETEEVAAVEVTVAAATFETVEIKAAVITISGYGVFYKAVKIAGAVKITKALKRAQHLMHTKLKALHSVSNILKTTAGTGGDTYNLKTGNWNSAAVRNRHINAGGVSIRGSPHFDA